MKDEKPINKAIKTVIKELMDRIMYLVLVEKPFLKEEHNSKKPLYAALVPDEIFKGSHFERKFVTKFGKVWEKLAFHVALAKHGEAKLEKTITGTIKKERLRRIQEVLNTLEKKNKLGGKQPNWSKEIEYIMQGNGEEVPISVITDLFISNRDTNESYAFEIKAPLPNSDQSKVSKEKIFKLVAMTNPQVNNAFFALPYNPYGKREDYAWSFPKRWFNMADDEVVFIGNDFWDFVGGENTYQNFISEINQLGVEYKERIYREFLGIEPPEGYDQNVLK